MGQGQGVACRVVASISSLPLCVSLVVVIHQSAHAQRQDHAEQDDECAREVAQDWLVLPVHLVVHVVTVVVGTRLRNRLKDGGDIEERATLCVSERRES